MTAATADEHAIQALLSRWAYARDSDDWATLSHCFHPDARIHISWIDANAASFIERSRAQALRRKPGAHMKHVMSAPWVMTRGDRAFCRSNAMLLIRDEIDGVWFDIESHLRFFDRVLRRDGSWRLLDRTGVYDKDRVDRVDGQPWPQPHDPSLPAAARELCRWLKGRGSSPMPGLISAYSQEETRLRDAGLAWLESDAR